jgi:hypothetical protein
VSTHTRCAGRAVLNELPTDGEVIYGRTADGHRHLVHVSEIAGGVS